MDVVSRSLVMAGVVLVALGLLLHLGSPLPFLGKLPGDIRIERPGLRFYLPITSCLVVSALVSGLLWLFSKLR